MSRIIASVVLLLASVGIVVAQNSSYFNPEDWSRNETTLEAQYNAQLGWQHFGVALTTSAVDTIDFRRTVSWVEYYSTVPCSLQMRSNPTLHDHSPKFAWVDSTITLPTGSPYAGYAVQDSSWFYRPAGTVILPGRFSRLLMKSASGSANADGSGWFNP